MKYCRQTGFVLYVVFGGMLRDVVDSLSARAGRVIATKAGSELDYSLQFCAAVRNPVIQAGVNNAAVHRWGLSDEGAEQEARKT
jgi:predicted heme/steroid binding protein